MSTKNNSITIQSSYHESGHMGEYEKRTEWTLESNHETVTLKITKTSTVGFNSKPDIISAEEYEIESSKLINLIMNECKKTT